MKRSTLLKSPANGQALTELAVVLPLLVLLLTGCGGAKQASVLSVGDIAPDFTLTASDGSEVALSDFQGKTSVLLYFNMADG